MPSYRLLSVSSIKIFGFCVHLHSIPLILLLFGISKHVPSIHQPRGPHCTPHAPQLFISPSKFTHASTVFPHRLGVGSAHGHVTVVDTVDVVEVTVGVVKRVLRGTVMVVISCTVITTVTASASTIDEVCVVVTVDVGVADVRLRQLHAVEITSHAK